MNLPKHILPVIVLSQFACTSLWFAGNGVMDDLILSFSLKESALGNLTSAVQFGFISGTLLFALFTISDRNSPSKVFLVSAIMGALFNLAIIWEGNSLITLVVFRFLTGFFLAGIYPVGMKIASDYYNKGLGKSLGFLVGALVLGTAFPHLLKWFGAEFNWRSIIISISCISVIGGLIMFLFVPDGPFRHRSQKPDFSAIYSVFKDRNFRSAAFGYFGHMWELYAFWAFIPVILSTYKSVYDVDINIPSWSFSIIGIGGLACIIGGLVSQKVGAKKTAFSALLMSAICSLAFPFVFQIGFFQLLIAFLLFWGMVVIADSPMFSTLVAQNCDPKTRGTALTIVNSIGFAITIVSIQFLSFLELNINSIYVYWILAIGPIIGLISIIKRSLRLTSP